MSPNNNRNNKHNNYRRNNSGGYNNNRHNNSGHNSGYNNSGYNKRNHNSGQETDYSSVVLEISREIEKQLKALYGASGSGIYQLMESVSSQLSTRCKENIQKIQKVRNTVAHYRNATLKDFEVVDAAYKIVQEEFQKKNDQKSGNKQTENKQSQSASACKKNRPLNPINNDIFEQVSIILQLIEKTLDEDYAAWGNSIREKIDNVGGQFSYECMQSILKIQNVYDAILNSRDDYRDRLTAVRALAKSVFTEFRKKNPYRNFNYQSGNSGFLSIIKAILNFLFSGK